MRLQSPPFTNFERTYGMDEQPNPTRSIDFAWRAHAAQEAWTAKVDGKAAILLALEVALIAAVISGLAPDGALSALTAVGAVTVRIGAVLITAAAVLAAIAVFPLLGSPVGHARDYRSNLIYFGHLRHWTDGPDLANRLRRLTDDDVLEQLARQLRQMSGRNWRKHRLLQTSILAALPGTLAVVVAALAPR